MRRRNSTAGFSCTEVIVKTGARPPSQWNASSRMASMRPAIASPLAIVKSHTSWRSGRETPARPSVLKRLSMCSRRLSNVASVVQARSR
jgi:hypothetical protein